MFTKKPEAGDSVTKMGERLGGESASKMIPSNIGGGPYDHRQCHLQG
jgi:hypothetical protein